MPGFRIDDSIRIMQAEKLKQLRNKRDNAQVKDSLQHLDAAAKDGSNIMSFVIEAVENYCTLGEIADCLRNVFGEYK